MSKNQEPQNLIKTEEKKTAYNEISLDTQDNDTQRSSRPSIVRKVCLHSEQAQRVFKRYFSQLDHAMFSISVISRAHGHDHYAKQIEHQIKNELKETEQTLAKKYAQVKVLRERLSIAEVEEMTRPITVRANISSYLALEFLQLIQNMDEFLCKFEPLVILGEIEYSERQSVTYEWQQHLIGLVKRVRSYSDELRQYHKTRAASDVREH